MGIQSGTFVHGGRSKDIPTRLLAGYQEALADPDLLELRRDIALVEARLGELLRKIDLGESGKLWSDVQRQFGRVLAARSKDPEKFQEELADLESLINRGASEWAAWDEVGRQVDRRKRLTESERKRLQDLDQMIPADRAMAMLAFVEHSVKANLDEYVDPKIARKVLSGISRDIRGTMLRAAR